MSPVTAKGERGVEPQPGVSFMEMREGLYKRPPGAKDDPPTRSCGKAALPGSPYCARLSEDSLRHGGPAMTGEARRCERLRTYVTVSLVLSTDL